MDIKFKLGSVAVHVTPSASESPGAKLDVKVEGLEYEVTGLNLGEYVQVLAMMPGMVRDFRAALEAPIPDNESPFGTAESKPHSGVYAPQEDDMRRDTDWCIATLLDSHGNEKIRSIAQAILDANSLTDVEEIKKTSFLEEFEFQFIQQYAARIVTSCEF